MKPTVPLLVAAMFATRGAGAQTCPTNQPSRLGTRVTWVEPYDPDTVMVAVLKELTILGYRSAVADTAARRVATEPSYQWPPGVDYSQWGSRIHPGQRVTVAIDSAGPWASISLEVRIVCGTGEEVPPNYGPESTVEGFVLARAYRHLSMRIRSHLEDQKEVPGVRCAPLEDGDRKLSICGRMARARPRDADAQLDYALAQIRFFKVRAGRDDAERALTLSNHAPAVYDSVGAALLGEKELTEAERWYTAAVTRWPDSAGFHRGLGTALARQGKHAGALSHFERAVALAASDRVSQFGAARALAALGRIPEATERCKAATPLYLIALQERPREWGTWIALGRCAAISGQHALAVSYFERAAQIDMARIRVDAELVEAINHSIEIAGPQEAAPLPARP